ncbi:membrane protein insertion efficiency factor YidD [Nakamurella sp. YIM 132084]|uniref:Putative membrane protein insertion efficiency factor n=1 Tax=Nakamurella leprariae TaxID=2803911 RepID=A0A938YG95_9ACTN|nr:membrane protein insertion efficiency factor YidD [Nakamurella leprariae]MBM9468966.1 membrane protein insertion efficiency factor YidD [Nakamurella leprariae]
MTDRVADRVTDPVGVPVRARSPLAALLILPVRGYQRFISAYTPPSCRYYPCCSSYAITALHRHGALRGLWLTARRLGRCNPWSTGGVDHVPPAGMSRREQNRWRRSQDQRPDPEVWPGAAEQQDRDHRPDRAGREPADPHGSWLTGDTEPEHSESSPAPTGRPRSDRLVVDAGRTLA